MEDLHDRQLAFQVKIAKSFHNFKSKGKDKMDVGNAEARLFGLEKNYTTFQVNHEKILKLEDLDTYFTSGLYDLVQDIFYDRKGEFLNFLETIKAKDAAPGASNSNAALVSPSSVQSTNIWFQSLPKNRFAKIFW